MKIFVLPKHKPAILDARALQAEFAQAGADSAATSGANVRTAHASSSEPSFVAQPMQQQTQQLRAVLVQDARGATLRKPVNELLNFTCVAAASKPRARLRLLLNDALLAQQESTDPVSEWPASSKLSASFALQPSHFAGNQAAKLRCVAQLPISFSAAASVAIVGGQTVRRPQAALAARLMAPQSTFERLLAKRQASAQRGIAYSSRQLRFYAEQVEAVLAQTKPNALLPPRIEARLLSGADSQRLFAAEAGEGREEAGQSSSFEASLGEASARLATLEGVEPLQSDRDAESRLFGINDLLNLTCATNGDESLNDESLNSGLKRRMRVGWLLNGRRVAGSWINSFNKSSGAFSFDARLNGRLRNRPAVTVAKPSSDSQTTKSLVLELSESLFALKELELSCVTSVEQSLLEFETFVNIVQQQSPAQTTTSNGNNYQHSYTLRQSQARAKSVSSKDARKDDWFSRSSAAMLTMQVATALNAALVASLLAFSVLFRLDNAAI